MAAVAVGVTPPHPSPLSHSSPTKRTLLPFHRSNSCLQQLLPHLHTVARLTSVKRWWSPLKVVWDSALQGRHQSLHKVPSMEACGQRQRTVSSSMIGWRPPPRSSRRHQVGVVLGLIVCLQWVPAIWLKRLKSTRVEQPPSPQDHLSHRFLRGTTSGLQMKSKPHGHCRMNTHQPTFKLSGPNPGQPCSPRPNQSSIPSSRPGLDPQMLPNCSLNFCTLSHCTPNHRKRSHLPRVPWVHLRGNVTPVRGRPRPPPSPLLQPLLSLLSPAPGLYQMWLKVDRSHLSCPRACTPSSHNSKPQGTHSCSFPIPMVLPTRNSAGATHTTSHLALPLRKMHLVQGLAPWMVRGELTRLVQILRERD